MTLEINYELPVISDLGVSFQRYRYPHSGWLSSLPRSVGALPIARGSPQLVAVPCPSGEALWIGLVHSGPRVSHVRITALHADDSPDGLGGSASDSTPLGGTEPFEVPPRYAIEGAPRGDGTWWALAREAPSAGAPAYRALELEAWTEGAEQARAFVHVDLIDPERFRILTGTSLAPLREQDAYGGWRLP